MEGLGENIARQSPTQKYESVTQLSQVELKRVN